MKSHFNTVWGIIFTTLFVLIMLPLPWFCNYEYVPSIAVIPNYIISWAVIAIVTLVLIFVWVKQCWNRPEYCEFDDEEEKKEEEK